MSLKDFLKDRQLPAKPNELKLFQRKEAKELQTYIKVNKMDAKAAKAITKQLTQQHEADLARPEEEFDVNTLKNFVQKDQKDEQVQQFLKRSDELDKHIENYRKTEMRGDKQAEQVEISQILRENGRRQINVAADGSCLFSSVGLAFAGRDLRAELLEYVKANGDVQETIKDFCAEDVEAYLKRMEKDWGDEVEVNILSKMLSCEIVVWSRHGKTIYGAHGGKQVEILHIQNGPGGMGHYMGVAAE